MTDTSTDGKAFNDGSTPVVVPAGKLGSPVRQSFWQKYFTSWGDKNASQREAQKEVDGIRNDIAGHQADLKKYQLYKAKGLNADQAIQGVLSTITGLQAALAQKLAEYKAEGLVVN